MTRVQAKQIALAVSGLVTVLLILGLVMTRYVDATRKRQGYLQAGNEMFEKAQYNEAADFYRQALQSDQRFAEAWYRLGLAQTSLGKPLDARADFKRAL